MELLKNTYHSYDFVECNAKKDIKYSAKCYNCSAPIIFCGCSPTCIITCKNCKFIMFYMLSDIYKIIYCGKILDINVDVNIKFDINKDKFILINYLNNRLIGLETVKNVNGQYLSKVEFISDVKNLSLNKSDKQIIKDILDNKRNLNLIHHRILYADELCKQNKYEEAFKLVYQIKNQKCLEVTNFLLEYNKKYFDYMNEKIKILNDKLLISQTVINKLSENLEPNYTKIDEID